MPSLPDVLSLECAATGRYVFVVSTPESGCLHVQEVEVVGSPATAVQQQGSLQWEPGAFFTSTTGILRLVWEANNTAGNVGFTTAWAPECAENTFLALQDVDRCDSLVLYEATQHVSLKLSVTAGDGNSGTTDTVYMSYLVEGAWTPEEVFFSSADAGSVSVASTSLSKAPTRLRLRITGHNAYCFLRMRITILGREVPVGSDLSSGGCNQDDAHQLDMPGDSTFNMGAVQQDWAIEFLESFNLPEPYGPYKGRQCKFGNAFYDQSCDLAGTSECSDGVVFRGRCFRLFEETKSWHDARSACLRWGGDLVSIHDKTEHRVLSRLVGATPASAGEKCDLRKHKL